MLQQPAPFTTTERVHYDARLRTIWPDWSSEFETHGANATQTTDFSPAWSIAIGGWANYPVKTIVTLDKTGETLVVFDGTKKG